ncbi:carbohydrate ABC transporter permease [Dactylosporangium matsuzakiense]|uniref:Sugar ABC transporter permease n=1 Tax=Dactylosporangium matsuzakiense TaxID=53360 RepID=A0A9W6KV97_9ACTN|nr:sugar ABC transporter permease [Dactylosporangium matsuzakiense]UWZ48490.1 sugar ABC transporter permease [Dactylosporangium matsuzakiense]GLL08717.1 sugar ABC transporter permease [Dactylosporangium matsuzakiense]
MTILQEVARPAGARPRPAAGHRGMRYLFVVPYTVLAAVFGVFPALYAVVLAFTDGAGRFAGVDNFAKVFGDFRFLPAVGHVATFLLIWLVALVVLVTFLAIVVHAVRVRWLSRTLRLVFYLPGAVAGASSVLLWLFVLDPTASPVAGLLRAAGFTSFNQVIAPGNLPPIFAVIAFWTGAGGWIVIMYGALNTIGPDMIEAARLDGASALQIALRIQLPLLRKWISYMGIMSLAAGSQLFVEPQLLSQASNAVVPNDYSLNQLAYLYAFQQNDFNAAAAVSLLLLIIALALSAVFVTRGGLFERD